jgi:hypothetical protein
MPGGPGLTTSGNCLNWFATQTDKMIFNRDYPAIVTNGLMLNFDAGFSPSFATIPSNANGTTVTPLYDLSSVGNNGTLANGPTYTPTNGGGIVLDGTDDTYSITGMTMGTNAFTLDCWFKYQTHNLYLPSICFAGDYWSGDNQTGWGFGQNAGASNYNFQMAELGSKLGVSLGSMVDGTIYNFVGTRTISGTKQIIRGYVNGNLVGSATGNTIFNLSTSTYFPGYNPTVLKPKQYSYTGPPPATLYNIKAYNRDLSAKEIIQNYQSMLPRFVGENIVTDGLILYLDAGYKSSYSGSGTTWNDVSGYGNNGTLTNGPTFNSSNGGAIEFDGVDDKALLFSNNNFPTSYTKFCFFKLKNKNNYYNLMSASSPVDHVLWVGTYATGVYRLAGSNNGGNNYSEVIISDELYENVWYSAAITFDNNTRQMRLYLNGILGSTATSTSISSGGICKIGEHSSGQSINGYVPIVMVYNRVLTASEILQNYNAQKGRYGL